MRVLLVTPFFAPAWAYGGMARATNELARALARLGHDVLVVTTRLDDAPAVEEEHGLRIRRFRSLPWIERRLFPWPPGLGRFLGAVCAAGRIDVGHIAGHRHGLAAVAAHALRRARVPWILQPHGTYPDHGAHRAAKRIVDGLFGRALVDDAAALVAVSDAEALDLPRAAHVIPNGVTAVGSAAAAPHPRSTRRLLFVGSDAPQKRGDCLVQVLDALPDTTLDLVGRFDERFRRRFGCHLDRVAWRGVLAGNVLASAYAEADLLIQPAVGEAFGLVAFEAALAGTGAVVAGGHGAGEWYARAGGCVVPPDDLPALLAATRVRLEQPAVAHREAQQVASFTRRELTWERAARSLEALYAEVIHAGPDARSRSSPQPTGVSGEGPREEKRALSRAIVSPP